MFESYPKDENGFLQYSFELADQHFLSLDTKKDELVSAGQYCEKRMRWFDSELSKTSTDVYIFMHHPPFEMQVFLFTWTVSK